MRPVVAGGGQNVGYISNGDYLRFDDAERPIGIQIFGADPAAMAEAAALVETAVLVMARRRVVFGLGVTQQHQTAHGRDLDSVLVWTNLQAHVPEMVTSAAAVRKKRHARDFHKCDQRPRRRRRRRSPTASG